MPVASPVLALDAATKQIELLERRARHDFAAAASQYLWIKPKEQPLARLRLNWPQRFVYERYLLPAWQARQPFAGIILKARREGMSTLIAAYHYHKVRWWRGQNCYQTAHDDDTVEELFSMVIRFHDNLPDELKPPTKHKTRQELEYAAPWDSHLRTRVAKYLDIGRGKTIHHAHLSEIAFYPDPETIFAGILDAVPLQGPTSIILESTANGAETWFESVCTMASRTREDASVLGGRRWQLVFLPWFWNPWNVLPVGPAFQLTAEEVDLQKRFILRPEQLAWRRSTLQEKELLHPGRGRKVFMQENPATPDEAFISSGECIFPEDALDRLKRQQRPPILGYQVVKVGTWRHALVRHPEPAAAPFQVWEPPRRGYEYTVGVDTARGGGRDDSAVVIIRMPEYRQVAQWYDNSTAPKQLAYKIAAMARYYGTGADTMPICIVEVNDAGILVNAELEAMRGLEPLDIYVWEYLDKVGQQTTTKTGWWTSYATKDALVGVANSLLMAGSVLVPSKAIQDDMKRTVEIVPKVYRTHGCDLTMAWLMAVFAAYRKIARWQPAAAEMLFAPQQTAIYPEDRDSDDAFMRDLGVYRDPVLYDATFQRRIRQGHADFGSAMENL